LSESRKWGIINFASSITTMSMLYSK
jgi:hypothetical protein